MMSFLFLIDTLNRICLFRSPGFDFVLVGECY